MSKRPWDRSNKGRGQTLETREWNIPDAESKDDANSRNLYTSSNEVPFVQVEGIKYYSDRFYLHRTASDPPVSNITSNTSSSSSAHSAYCSCKVPPLLDRVKLINSLDLKAVICATYTLDLAWMATAFPQLCGPEASVPTLILHGQKGLSNKMEEQRRAKNQECDSSSDEEDNDDCKITNKTAAESDQNNPPEEAMGNVPQPEFQYDTLGPLLHVTQVLPRWLPRSKQSPSASREDRRKHSEGRLGVMHAKYFILFTTDGSVIVVVSTGNLTCDRSTDASWVQKFAPLSNGCKKIPRSQQRRNGSDFGAVLTDFLKCQSDAAEKRGLLPEEFLKKYMHHNSLSTLEQSYQFSKAQVHLIATVPGDYESRFAREHLKRDGDFVDFLYGRQRVADIVSRLNQDVEDKRWQDDAWFPEVLLSKYDRLILQPTSIGAHWTLKNLSNVVRSYLGNDDKTKLKGSTPPSSTKKQKGNKSKNKYSDAKYCGDDQKMLDRLDIIWPSMKLMKMIARSNTTRTDSPRSVVDVKTTGEARNGSSKANSDDPVAMNAFCFMASKSFNLIQPACLSQLAMFEPSVPAQREPMTPHIKTVARLYEGDERALKNEHGVGHAENYFPWLLLTSACLSHGAQGKMKESEIRDNDMLSYSNFELGVMFCSRLQGSEETDRLYCWKPARCTCSYPVSDTQKSRLIHLPLPYSCHPTPYQLHSDETRFSETPFFHEIEAGSEMVGNMRCLPRQSSPPKQMLRYHNEQDL